METAAHAPAKRRRRARAGKDQAEFTIPVEVLAVVCTYFQKTPRHIFLTMKACKGLRAHLTSEWWQQFWAVHKATVLDRKLQLRHHYLNEVVHGPNVRPSQFAHILRLVYSLRCERCGARWNHRIVNHLRLRLCDSCLRDNVVSSRVLYYRYGLSVAEVIDEHSHLITYFPVSMYHRRDASFRELSADPIDLEGFGSDGLTRQELMFLWRPDVARLYDLDALYALQQRRLAAADRLKACMRRRRVWAAIHDTLSGRRRSRCIAHALHQAAAHEIHITVPPTGHFVGGPAYVGSLIKPFDMRRVIECNVASRASYIYFKLQTSTPRPLLGFNEVCSKTWLEKFGGINGPSGAPPDTERAYRFNSHWHFPLNVYSVRTGQLLFNGNREHHPESRVYPPRFMRFPPPRRAPPTPPRLSPPLSPAGRWEVVVVDDDSDGDNNNNYGDH